MSKILFIILLFPFLSAAQYSLSVYGNSFAKPNIKMDYGLGFSMNKIVEDERLEDYVSQVITIFEDYRKKKKISVMHEFLLIKTYVQRTLSDKNVREYCLFDILKRLGYGVLLIGSKEKVHCMLHLDADEHMLLTNNALILLGNTYIPGFWENAEEDPSYHDNIMLKVMGGRSLKIDTCLHFKKGPLDTLKFPANTFYALKRNIDLSGENFFELEYKLKFPVDSHFYKSILNNFDIEDDVKSIERALKFVQGEIQYDEVDNLENGWQLPLQTMFLKKGNCSSKSFLFSTIVSICTRKYAYIVVFNDKKRRGTHALSAFSDEDVGNDYSKLTFCETTMPGWPVGNIADNIKDIIKVIRVNKPKLSCDK